MLAEAPPRNETARGQALWLRDRAMLELLYAGGVRISELADARLEDLKLEMGYILVRGKGDKERMVPLGVPAQHVRTGVASRSKTSFPNQLPDALTGQAAASRAEE